MNTPLTKIALHGFLVVGFLCVSSCDQAKQANTNRKNFADRSYVRNNLAQLASAGQLYCWDNKVTTVSFEQLLSSPNNYIIRRNFKTVDGEDYSKLDFSPSVNSWTITTASGLMVTYERPPKPNPESQAQPK